MRTVLELIEVSKQYGDGDNAVKALRNVSMKINAGSLTVVAGPSGSGKSTLLSILGCLMQPTAGQIRFMGQNICAWDQAQLSALRRQRYGFVFQGIHLLPALTAGENIRLAVEVKERPELNPMAEAKEMLARVGIPELIDRMPKDMSGGQRQRAAIARALAGRPGILLADEPTAALDQKNAHSILQLLQKLTRELGVAVLMVTHDRGLFRFADRLLKLEDGIMEKPKRLVVRRRPKVRNPEMFQPQNRGLSRVSL